MTVRTVSNLIGETFGHYKILDQLGAGGMGVVYRAQDLKLGRQVALKVLPPGATANDEAVERFKREARTASALNHPNICTIYGFDEHEGQLYLAMELLDGDPLDQRLLGKPIELQRMLDIAAQVADALDAAHSEGILHRDVKPANIFLTKRGPVKVLDFGLAKLAPNYRRPGRQIEAERETQVPEHFTSVAGTTVGTIAYMSPEQARGDDVDPRTDLFSFGVVLYEMATGRVSFPGNTTAVVFDGILNREPAAPSSLNANVPSELDRIVSKALEKDRTLRYQTAADLGADLKRLRRDASSRHIPVAAPLDISPDTATVVISSGVTVAGGSGSGGSGSGEWASSPPPPTSVAPPPPPARPALSAITKSAVKSPAAWGAGAAVLVIAAIAAAIGAYVATRGGQPPSPVNQTASAPAVTAPAVTAPAEAPPTSAPPPPPAPAVSGKPAAPAGGGTVAVNPAAAAARPAGGNATATRPATKAPPPAPVAPAPAPAPVSREAEAAQRLEVARAKVANNLNDQALADLRQIIIEYPGSRAGAEASLLAAELHEKTGKLEDAMAAYVEFESRFKGDRRAAESKMRRAGILGRSRQPRAVQQSRELLNEVVREFPGTPQAQQALQAKLRIETDRKDFREIDPVLKVEVPSVLVTLRTFITQFPDGTQSMVARNRLAMMLAQMDRHEDAAQLLEELAVKFPDNPMDAWFRVGEIYERRLKNPVKAKEAYAKVPPGTARYNDAQQRLKRR
ncbi:MAG: protein kinase [Acidobacteriota bacterium]|nr:protein kinase [Acidobacteriota bacterium]